MKAAVCTNFNQKSFQKLLERSNYWHNITKDCIRKDRIRNEISSDRTTEAPRLKCPTSWEIDSQQNSDTSTQEAKWNKMHHAARQ